MPTVTINNRSMHYQDQGEGFPIILGHSYLWDSNMWAPQSAVLSKKYRCIVPDVWGHGLSAPVAENKYSIEQLAADYWQFIQALGLDECALIGLSVGGMWATHLALQHPECVKALVLMDTYVGPEPAATQEEYFTLLDAIEAAQGIGAEMAQQIAPYFFSPQTFANKLQLVQQFQQDLMALKSENISGICTLGRAIFTRTSLLEQLPQITQPSLVMVGEDDGPRPPSEAKEMAELIPGAELKIIAAAGHIANIEQPEEVTRYLQSFLAETVLETKDVASTI